MTFWWTLVISGPGPTTAVFIYRVHPIGDVVFPHTHHISRMFTFNFFDDEVPQSEKNEQLESAVPVRSVALEDALAQLPDTLAFSFLGGLPRRELWHVKMQLMQNDHDSHLLGQWDVVKGSYEGGLKTWECSVDLAAYLSSQTYPEEFSVLEVLDW